MSAPARNTSAENESPPPPPSPADAGEGADCPLRQSSPAPRQAAIHANALLIGEAGVLIRGVSGSGKSILTLELIGRARASGHFARLIGDDRVELVNRNGRLIARPHPRIAGKIEIRGHGIVSAEHESAGVIRAVIDLFEAESPPPRMPEPGENETKLCETTLPVLFERAGSAGAAGRILTFVHKLMTK